MQAVLADRAEEKPTPAKPACAHDQQVGVGRGL
jgi:hypothetical protein